MRCEIVEDDDVAGLQGRSEDLLRIGGEPGAGHGAIKDHGRSHPGQPQSADKRGCLPVSVRQAYPQSLAARCGLADRVTFIDGDALNLPFDNDAFDVVFLQHVAMNIEDRVGLYAEVRRILKPQGRFATYDVVMRDGDVIYPVPWARDASTSFLLTPDETRAALEAAGFTATLWRDDTQTAADWFNAVAADPPSTSGLNLGVVMGADFPGTAGNLGRNIRDGRLGILSAVLIRD